MGRLRRPAFTLPSWSSTATPSDVSHTSLSSPVAPSRSASLNASMVLSSACARPPRWAKAIGGERRDSRMKGLYVPGDGRIEPMEALWLLLIPVLLVGGFFMIRSFMRLSKSIVELRTAMNDLAEAGAALNDVQAEVAKLGATVDEQHRQ
jgi:hypothetical protein